MEETKGPVCPKCGHAVFDDIPLVEFNMMFVCCSKCGAVIAYRDHILIDKLDQVFEVLSDIKQTETVSDPRFNHN